MIFSFGLIVLGLTGLLVGGELVVRGASELATAARISPLIIGITVVSFGTSTPELAVTVQAAGKKSFDERRKEEYAKRGIPWEE